jgi:hypothetical protein
MTFTERVNFVNEKRLNILAIDIGNNGGFAWNFHPDRCFELRVMPEDVMDRWFAAAHCSPDIIVAEDVHTIHGQGIVSNGTLMKNKGQVEGFCAAMEIEPHWIQPLAWIQCFTLKRTKHFANKHKWKQHLIEIAKGIAYGFSDSLVNEINEKTADAFLIWNYAASQQTDQPLKPPNPFK